MLIKNIFNIVFDICNLLVLAKIEILLILSFFSFRYIFLFLVLILSIIQ